MFFAKSKEKELKMIWEVKKNDERSFLVGTAHFFPYSFRSSLSRYIKNATAVLFEGPLDKDSMGNVVNAGFEKETVPHLFESLDTRTIANIVTEIAPAGRDRFLFSVFNSRSPGLEDPVYAMLKGMKPWLAFFTIWSKFLEKKGWKHSVDLEAYAIATEMGRNVLSLETIEEQIKVLESLSHERIAEFLKRINQWNSYAKEYVKYYLEGDLEKLSSIWSGFPSRRFSVIEGRDQILLGRMLKHIEKGGALACVGSPHIRGISEMLRTEGYEVHQLPSESCSP